MSEKSFETPKSSKSNKIPHKSESSDKESFSTITSGGTINEGLQSENEDQLRIDFVLAHDLKDEDPLNEQYRTLFEVRLQHQGLILEESINKDFGVRFVKIHAPWEVLTKVAEKLRLVMPISEKNEDKTSQSWKICNCLYKYLYNYRQLLPDLPTYVTAWFLREKQCQFLITDKETFFSSAQRSNMTYYILDHTWVEYEHCDASPSFLTSFVNRAIYLGDSTTTVFVGIRNLLSYGIYSAAYPLHEGNFEQEEEPNLRQTLDIAWVRWKNAFQKQPLDHIKLYFGERLAFYFAWLGYYTWMLIPAGIGGILSMIYGIHHVSAHVHSDIGDICNEKHLADIDMCPRCTTCPIWKLSDVCVKTKLTDLFDHSGTFAFAVFMALWAVIFEELWKRQEARLRHHWHMKTFSAQEDIRPQYMAYKGRRATMVVNPETELFEPKVTPTEKYFRYGWSISAVLLVLAVNIVVVFAMIVFRLSSYEAVNTQNDYLFFKDNNNKGFARAFASFVSALLNVVTIIILGKFYHWLAKVLTDYELHRTDSNWENSYIFKLFLFEFINNFTPLFYLAFIKGKINNNPNENIYIAGVQIEDCVLGECFIDLSIQIFFIMAGFQIRKHFLHFYHRLLACITTAGKEGPTPQTQWEKDYTLEPIPEQGGIIDEYLEMVIQYAHVTLFAAAFPLAPLIALFNNVVEIRVDAKRYVRTYRRAIARRAEGIHIWFTILKIITRVAIVTNAVLLSFTSNYINKEIFRYQEPEHQHGNYVNFSLSVFNVSNLLRTTVPHRQQTCRYFGFHEKTPPYRRTKTYWVVLSFEFILIVTFVGIVQLFAWIIDYALSDLPYSVRLSNIREAIFINRAILELGKESSVIDMVKDEASDRFFEEEKNVKQKSPSVA